MFKNKLSRLIVNALLIFAFSASFVVAAGDGTISQLKDFKLKISSNDTTPNFLINKLVAGTGITLTENNDGANETLTISSSGGGSGWGLTGNAGTTAGTNFVGTTDDVDFVTKTSGVERMRIKSSAFSGASGSAIYFPVTGWTEFYDVNYDTFWGHNGTSLATYISGASNASYLSLDSNGVSIENASLPFSIKNGITQRFYETGNGNYIGLKAGTIASDFTLTLPTTDSTGTQALVSNGSGALSWVTLSTGDVTAASTFGTDNRLIRSDGTGKGVQASTASLTDAGALSGLTDVTSTGQFLGGDGTVSLPTYSFSGDPDTGWYRSGSTMRYAKDGIERIRITSAGNISVNNNATGLATSNGIFHGTYDADPNDQDGIVTIDTYSDEGWTTTIGGRRARGTALAPTQIMAGDKIVEFIGKGWHGGGAFAASNRALMGFYANENWDSSTDNGTYITLNTTTDNTGANHQSVLIDDEGNVAINDATTSTTTSVFPAEWAATNSKHLVVKSGGTARDAGFFIRNSDDTAGIDSWYDTNMVTHYTDLITDNANANHTFRLRTLGTDIIPMKLDVNGALLGVGSNLRLQGSSSGTATIVAPAAAGTPTLTLPTTTGTFALTADKLSAFAATTSTELAGVISDETGSGSLVFATSPTFVTPTLGTFAATAGTMSGKMTTYNGITTANNGLVSTVGTPVKLTGQSAAIAATSLYTADADGFYVVNWNAARTQAATVSSTLGHFQVQYTNPADNVVKTTPTQNNVTASASNVTTGTGSAISGSFTVYAKSGTNINYIMGYTSAGATPMNYSLNITVSKL